LLNRCNIIAAILCYTGSWRELTVDKQMEIQRRPLRGPARERFRALLKLASESPFEGERENAMAAATRLAEQHGLSLDEAARPTSLPPEDRRRGAASETGYTASEFASYFDIAERGLRADKERREAALRDAIDRGLDAGVRSGEAKTMRRKATTSRAQRNPRNHARVLLAETSFSLMEIVNLTGLDIYEVVGMKLKMRATA
jgi:hypothetical protein